MIGLRDLAAMCRQCPGLNPLSTHHLQQPAGIELGEPLAKELQSLLAQGRQIEQIATVAEAVADTRRREPTLDQVLDWVLSRPEAPRIRTRDTAAVMHALLVEAKQEVLLVG
jgi:hypothetical protein